MSKIPAESFHLSAAQSAVERRTDLAHLRVRKYGDTLVFESGPERDAFPHFRLRRVTRQWWTPEVRSHSGRWDPIPMIRAPISEALDELRTTFPWIVAPIR